MRILILILLSFGFTAQALEIKSQSVNYKIGTKNFSSLLYYTEGKKDQPGIILAPEWWGITALEKKEAARLAGQGYVVLVIDFFGNGASTLDADKAQEMMDEAQEDTKQLKLRYDTAYKKLIESKKVDPEKVGAIGFGFGGGVVVEQLRHGDLDIKTIVDFFGGLKSPDHTVLKKPEFKYDILILVGEHDAFVNAEQIQNLKKEFFKSRANLDIQVWPKTYHDFTRPEADKINLKYKIPMKYDAAITDKSWKMVDELLAKTIGKK